MPFTSENIANGPLIRARSNFVVAITFPRLLGAFKPQGAFGWYAAWNIVGFFAILLFVPETKALSLEELDQGEYRFSDDRCLACFYSRTPTQSPSLFGANAYPCGVSDQGATAQHQEVHLPHEGRSITTALRVRRWDRGEGFCARGHGPQGTHDRGYLVLTRRTVFLCHDNTLQVL